MSFNYGCRRPNPCDMFLTRVFCLVWVACSLLSFSTIHMQLARSHPHPHPHALAIDRSAGLIDRQPRVPAPGNYPSPEFSQSCAPHTTSLTHSARTLFVLGHVSHVAAIVTGEPCWLLFVVTHCTLPLPICWIWIWKWIFHNHSKSARARLSLSQAPFPSATCCSVHTTHTLPTCALVCARVCVCALVHYPLKIAARTALPESATESAPRLWR